MKAMQKNIAAPELKLKPVKVSKRKQEELFLKKYDEVLNKNILSVFRRTMEETERAPDHRALKIIKGQVVRLRLDSLNGQADGIKVYYGNDTLPMYIWFSPDVVSKKIVFKMMVGSSGSEMVEQFDLEEVSKEFLLDFISKKHRKLLSFLS
jgi:hypothetical protein